MPEASTGKGLLENWKCLLACTLVSMSPFQYGIDFGLIGGLQAMPGFLAVGHIDFIDLTFADSFRSLATRIQQAQLATTLAQGDSNLSAA